MTINNRLRQFGELHYSTAKDFAEALEIYPQSLNNYYAGKRTPSVDIIQRLILLGCNPLWLLTGKGTMTLQEFSEKNDKPFDVYNSDASHIISTIPASPKEAFERLDLPGYTLSWDSLNESQRLFYESAYYFLCNAVTIIRRDTERSIEDAVVLQNREVEKTLHQFHQALIKHILSEHQELSDLEPLL